MSLTGPHESLCLREPLFLLTHKWELEASHSIMPLSACWGALVCTVCVFIGVNAGVFCGSNKLLPPLQAPPRILSVVIKHAHPHSGTVWKPQHQSKVQHLHISVSMPDTQVRKTFPFGFLFDSFYWYFMYFIKYTMQNDIFQNIFYYTFFIIDFSVCNYIFLVTNILHTVRTKGFPVEKSTDNVF